MYLSQALDIHVIQYIAPMCKKLTKLAPFQIAGKCRVSGTEAQPLLIHSAFYFNWVGLRTSRGCSRGPRLAGARGPAVRGGDIPPALPGAGAHPNRHHGKVTQGPPGPETSSAGPLKASNAVLLIPARVLLVRKKREITLIVGMVSTRSTRKPFPRECGPQGPPSPLQTCTPAPQPSTHGCLEGGWAGLAEVGGKSVRLPPTARQGHELRLPHLSLK